MPGLSEIFKYFNADELMEGTSLKSEKKIDLMNILALSPTGSLCPFEWNLEENDGRFLDLLRPNGGMP